MVWRQQFNPLRGLTILRVGYLLEAAERGWYSELQWLFRFIEKRDATLRAVKKRRQAAIKKLDWDIKINSDVLDPTGVKFQFKQMAEDQAAYARELLEGIDNLKEAIDHLALAEFRGFSHLEKHWDNDGLPYHLEPVPHWHWCKRFPDNRWRFDKLANSNNGVPINPVGFVIREVDDPIDEIAAIAHMRKNLSQKDWDGFIETFGIPPIFIQLPENSSQNKNIAEWQDFADQVISDARGVLPNGATVATIKDGERGMNPFRDHVDYQDQQIVLAGTSGKLTVLNEPTGLGSGQSDSHMDTFDELAIAEAAEISEIIQSQLLDLHIMEKFPHAPEPFVYFELAAKDVEDTQKLVDNVVALSGAGLQADAAEVSEKTGLKLTRQENAAGGPGMESGFPGAAPSPVPAQAGANLSPAPGLQFRNKRAMELFREVCKEVPQGHQQTAAKLERFFANQLRAIERSSQLEAGERIKRTARDQVGEAMAHDLEPVRNRIEAIMRIDDVRERDKKLRELKAELPAILEQINTEPQSAKVMERAMTAELFNGMETAEA